VLVALDHLGVEAVLKEVPHALVELVEPLRVDAVDPMERTRDRLHRALYDRMHVVGHEAVGVNLKLVFLDHPAKEHEKKPVVLDVAEDQAPVNPADGDVEDPVCREHPSRNARHPCRLAWQQSPCHRPFRP
jgi:hypothetical protein